jgi:3-deoxy-manno-octulosonate cytidylyltransferase (CMP-KDO synthetase)
MASTRLARKPLALIQGKPMIQRVYENAVKCHEMTRVVVATDNEEIADIITNIGGHVEMTAPEIATGSDRAATVATRYPDMDIIVNLQGDQPFIKPSMLSELVSPYLAGERPEMTTLACPLDFTTDHNDPNAVKVILDKDNNAIYFSRSPIPHFRNQDFSQVKQTPVHYHIGLYAYRRDFLQTYTKLAQTPCELAELLEQLRVLENGYRIRVCLTSHKILEINTPEELLKAQQEPLAV